MLAIARPSLKDTLVTIVSLDRVRASYVVGVSLGCITTVRESDTHDPRDNKHALTQAVVFSPSPFPVGAMLCSVSILAVCCGAE